MQKTSMMLGARAKSKWGKAPKSNAEKGDEKPPIEIYQGDTKIYAAYVIFEPRKDFCGTVPFL